MKFLVVSTIVLLVSLLTSSVHARPNNKISLKKNMLRNTRSQGNVVSRPPILKMRVVPPQELSLPLGSNKVLECEAGGNPAPTIHWLKNGKVIIQDSDEILAMESEESPRATFGFAFTRSRLYLDCLQPQDEAVFTCVADNAFERKSSTSNIKVTDIISQDGDLDSASNSLVFCPTRKSYGSPARITMWTKTRMELMGNDVRLFCRSQGYPKPTVSWLNPEGNALISNDKTLLMENGDLIIRDLRWGDMGAYQCLVSNQEADDQSTTFVYPIQPEKS